MSRETGDLSQEVECVCVCVTAASSEAKSDTCAQKNRRSTAVQMSGPSSHIPEGRQRTRCHGRGWEEGEQVNDLFLREHKGRHKVCSQAQLRAKGFFCWVNGLLFSTGLTTASRNLLKVLQACGTVVPPSWTSPQGVILMCPMFHPQPLPGDTALASLGPNFSGFGSYLHAV